MANQFVTSRLITPEAVATFESMCSFLPTAYRAYEGMFTAKTYAPGDTVDVRLDNFFQGQRGDSVTAEDIVAAVIPLTIGPLYSVPIAYRPTDLQRDFVDFTKEFIIPAVRRVRTMMNETIAMNVLTQVNYWQGDTTAAINSFKSVDAITPIMLNLAMDPSYRKYLVVSPTDAHELRSNATLQNSFVTPLNKEITMEARLNRLADFDVLTDNQIVNFAGGTKNINPPQTAFSIVNYTATTITIGNCVNGEQTFAAGDIIYLPNTMAFNQVTRRSAGIPMPFTVVSNPSPAAGNQVTVNIFPNMILSGPRQNMETAPAINDPVNAVANHNANVAYTERGLVCVIPPLERMDSPDSYTFTSPKTGVSMRISKTAEVLNNKNIMRLDCQMATTFVPQQVIRKVSKYGQVAV